MPSLKKTDWHVHYFRDGCAGSEMTVDALLAAAAANGIEEMGLLGHFRNRFVINDLAYWTEPNPKFFDFLRNDLSAAKSSLKIRVSAEADINTLDGDVSITTELASQLDFVMIGIHWPPTLPPLVDYADLQEPAQLLDAYCSYNRIRPEEFSVERLIGDMFRSMINAVSRNPFVDILAHPAGFATRLGPFCIEMDTASWFEEMAAALKTGGVAYELNASTFPEYPPDVLERFVKPFIGACAEAGVMFAIGSDAHRLKEVGNLSPALHLKEELKIPDDLFVTSLEEFPKRSA